MPRMAETSTITLAEWRAKATALFGPCNLDWRFICPACGHVASVQDWKDAGAPATSAAFSCVGRWTGAAREAFGTGDGPCNYAGGGLFRLNPVAVVDPDGHVTHAFAFADPAPVLPVPIEDTDQRALDALAPAQRAEVEAMARGETVPGFPVLDGKP